MTMTTMSQRSGKMHSPSFEHERFLRQAESIQARIQDSRLSVICNEKDISKTMHKHYLLRSYELNKISSIYVFISNLFLNVSSIRWTYERI